MIIKEEIIDTIENDEYDYDNPGRDVLEANAYGISESLICELKSIMKNISKLPDDLLLDYLDKIGDLETIFWKDPYDEFSKGWRNEKL